MSEKVLAIQRTHKNHDIKVEYENGFYYYSVLDLRTKDEVIGGWLSKEEAPFTTVGLVAKYLIDEVNKLVKGE